jgi:hypothetical protein
MTYNICNECETVAHCSKHGCIPVVALEPKEVRHFTHKDILRSVAKDSGLDVYGLGLDRDKWEAALGRYTEIIVRECLKIAKNREDEFESAGLLEESNAVGNVAYRISRQFGVKR